MTRNNILISSTNTGKTVNIIFNIVINNSFKEQYTYNRVTPLDRIKLLNIKLATIVDKNIFYRIFYIILYSKIMRIPVTIFEYITMVITKINNILCNIKIYERRRAIQRRENFT